MYVLRIAITDLSGILCNMIQVTFSLISLKVCNAPTSYHITFPLKDHSLHEFKFKQELGSR